MPRIRSIKPQFWLDENLGTLPRDARLLYIGLWNIADDTGVFEWRPAKIKAQLFPYDTDISPTKIEEWLQMIEGIGDIKKFTNNENKAFGHIRSFLEHQQIQHPSKYTFVDTPQGELNEPSMNPHYREEGKGEGEEEEKIKEEGKGEEDIPQDKKAKEIWEECLGLLKEEVNQANFRAWLKGTVGLLYGETVFIIGVPSEDIARHLMEHMRSRLENVLMHVTKKRLGLGYRITKKEQDG